MRDYAPIKLVAMDLDDTLLNSGLSLSPRSISAIRKAREAGMLMTFATNRGFRASRPFIEPLGISGLLITYGGTQTRDAENGKIIHELLIEKSIVAKALGFAGEHGVYLHMQRDDDIFYCKACAWSERSNMRDWA